MIAKPEYEQLRRIADENGRFSASSSMGILLNIFHTWTGAYVVGFKRDQCGMSPSTVLHFTSCPHCVPRSSSAWMESISFQEEDDFCCGDAESSAVWTYYCF